MDSRVQITGIVVAILVLFIVLYYIYAAKEEPKKPERPAEQNLGTNSWHFILFDKNRNEPNPLVFVLEQKDERIAARVFRFPKGEARREMQGSQKFENLPNELYRSPRLNIYLDEKGEVFNLRYDKIRFKSRAKHLGEEIAPNVYLSFLHTDARRWGYVIFTHGEVSDSPFQRSVATNNEGEIIILDSHGGQLKYFTSLQLGEIDPQRKKKILESTAFREIRYPVAPDSF